MTGAKGGAVPISSPVFDTNDGAEAFAVWFLRRNAQGSVYIVNFMVCD